jgi:fatty acid desaturase
VDPVEEPTLRKPLGALAICALALGWCVLVASLSGIVGRWPGWVQPVFYLVTGIVGIAPLKPLLRWMETGRWR